MMSPDPRNRRYSVDPRLLLGGYCFTVFMIAVGYEPGIVSDYVRVILIAGVVVGILWRLWLAFAHGLDPWTHAAAAFSWIAPTVYLTIDVYNRLGEDLSWRSGVLAFTVVTGYVWMAQVNRERRRVSWKG